MMMLKEPTNFLSGEGGWDFWTLNIFFKINKEDIRNEINIYTLIPPFVHGRGWYITEKYNIIKSLRIVRIFSLFRKMFVGRFRKIDHNFL